ncbi:hypothetical protein [Pseudomonas antarctica]|uniref:hypothetical protein n=1 Tax=Pseudomonas antarctica TaxID=219572 RepID=UPI0012EA2CA1|nr:hypothetical protein [Pseudomonas antarctica]
MQQHKTLGLLLSDTCVFVVVTGGEHHRQPRVEHLQGVFHDPLPEGFVERA